MCYESWYKRQINVRREHLLLRFTTFRAVVTEFHGGQSSKIILVSDMVGITSLKISANSRSQTSPFRNGQHDEKIKTTTM